MAMNPANLFKLMQMKGQFEKNHPKVLKFLQNEVLSGVPEGTVLEVSVTKPGQNKVTANIKVTADDLAMLEELKNFQQ